MNARVFTFSVSGTIVEQRLFGVRQIHVLRMLYLSRLWCLEKENRTDYTYMYASPSDMRRLRKSSRISVESLLILTFCAGEIYFPAWIVERICCGSCRRGNCFFIRFLFYDDVCFVSFSNCCCETRKKKLDRKYRQYTKYCVVQTLSLPSCSDVSCLVCSSHSSAYLHINA